MTNIIKRFVQEKIVLSVYEEDDTPATRVTAEVDGHDVQIVQPDDGGKATVSVDGHIKQVDLKKG